MSTDLVYLLGGAALALAVVLPVALARWALSAPLVLVGVGGLIGLLPLDERAFSPFSHPEVTLHLTELCVLVALMGVGLALDRRLSLRRLRSWRDWAVTWRLLGIAMPLTIAGVAVLSWGVLGLAPASALLLGAALSPTDPVLASDVQVGGPATPEPAQGHKNEGDEAVADVEDGDGEAEHIDETDEVRFALTSEAGVNDGLAFPFVYAALLLVSLGSPTEWVWRWIAWELVGKVVIGVAIGAAVGWLVSRVAFRAPRESLRVADKGEPLLALAVLLLTYGVAEVAGGYGFLAVFAAAMTMRSVERHSHYHALMHQMIERLERLLTLTILLLIGISLSSGMLNVLTWGSVAVAVGLVFVIRPLAGWLSLAIADRNEQVAGRPLRRADKLAIGFFGVRGIGTIYYLAYATGKAAFPQEEQLWATAALTIVLSVVVHGVLATPVLSRVERLRGQSG
ncbi:cation transporter [Enemella dayhoffiae]|uniref:Cation transporter n=1 Tax=Enemella dayhoffiae TaxID=2016507 RepID=A0A255HCK2_9ACTN|nr:cation:proton antiporter [Enemella dayhoffiae]OYO25182.1 cation transporter [Enemella dayhoffiae]